MDNYSGNKEYNIYRDIRNRTNGEIYLGVVGPVRTGKSTFIKRFMELMVLPFMDGEAEKERAMDELPQAAAGKTIMTTEPKFIPQQAAEIRLSAFKMEEEPLKLRVRLVDCVGFLADGAVGHMEGNGSRMVKTPWSDQEIPFAEAASIGTEKVIRDHATIGIVVTTDGTIGELERENYINAEERTVRELKNIGKPFVILLNSAKPYAQETVKLALEMEENYQTTVVPVNCEQLRREDVLKILESVLYEFPIERVEFFIPKWTEMLSADHPVKSEIITQASDILSHMEQSPYPGLLGLLHCSVSDLKKIHGIGTVKAVQLKCIGELSKRIASTAARISLDFNSPDSIAAYYMEDMRYYRQEHLKLLMLNTRSRLIGESEISRGTVNMSVISPRELFIEALQKNAVYIILLHNHPSGDPMPSREDILVTQRIREGGSLLGIELLDHIIIGDNCYVSLAEQKLLKEK